MSRDLYVVALDLAAFQRVQGSRDHALLRRVLEERGRMIAAHDAHFRSSAFPRAIPLAVAFTRIIDGTVDARTEPSPQYEHAAALLADTLGESVDDDLVREVVPDFYEDVDHVIRLRTGTAQRSPSAWLPIGDVMCRGPLLDIPLDPAARLGTGFFTRDEVRAALDVASRLDLDHDTGLEQVRWPEDALEIAVAYRDWLRAAARLGVGLFFHY